MRSNPVPFLLALALLGACGQRAPVAERAAPPAADAVSDFSVYELPGSWRDQSGRERDLASLTGRVQIVAMVYTECTHTCPAILAEFKQIQAELDPALTHKVGFVFVSLAPARDTPERLAAYAGSARLEADRWTLLSGSEGSVRELAALLGIRYREEVDGEISHANMYFVLDPAGRIAHRQSGLRTRIPALQSLLLELAADS